MKLSLVRLVVTLMLSGQMLPIGLPLVCDQVQRSTAGCEEQMATRPGPTVAAATHAVPCANSAFCAVAPTAVPALNGVISAVGPESQIIAFGSSTLDPADPQPPLPPPPQA